MTPPKRPISNASYSEKCQQQLVEFTVMYQSRQNLRHKVSALEQIGHEKKIDSLMLTEHWLTKDQLVKQGIDGYNLVANFCWDAKQHGGSVIYVSKSLIAKERTDIVIFQLQNALNVVVLNSWLFLQYLH